ncbi:class I SAM-dependent methyltransferase [Streptomyces sp. NPDC001843]|uniref:class I SAM-dependent methyltransferase n=1 Tax=Streptomyces sp. NPDC001843 TaxID=3364617 RepID=UPI00368AD03C
MERWCARADAADLEVLSRCEGAVLDVGCGPGRLVAALAAQGWHALGIDVSEAAVAGTVRRGGAALCRSVFEPLPGEGGWGTALLLDGNIGIGGDPAALLDRPARLPVPGGLLVAETAPVDVDERTRAQVVDATVVPGPAARPFPWAPHPSPPCRGTRPGRAGVPRISGRRVPAASSPCATAPAAGPAAAPSRRTARR